MTRAQSGGTRRLQLRCKEIPDAATCRRLADRLAPADCEWSDRRLQVQYAFPALSAADIWRACVECGIDQRLRPRVRLLCRLRAALELNERAHQQRPAGLRRHADRAAMLLAAPARAGERRLWRKHERGR